MQFGLEKCGVLLVEKGVKKWSEGITLPGGGMIRKNRGGRI